MAKGNSFQSLAAEAAVRITEAQASGAQLTFLPDEAGPGESERAKRGKGRAQSQLRDWLAARGMRLPEEVLIEMAGMASTTDAFVTAMARTEQVLAWAQAGATGYGNQPVAPSMVQRLAAFQFVFTAQLRSAEALLPYGLAKVTPEQGSTVVNQIIMPGAAMPLAPADRADQARDVTGQARRIVPPPMPAEMQRNQGLAKQMAEGSDGDTRTEGAKR